MFTRLGEAFSLSSCILVLITQSGLVVQELRRPAEAAERTLTRSVLGVRVLLRLALDVEYAQKYIALLGATPEDNPDNWPITFTNSRPTHESGSQASEETLSPLLHHDLCEGGPDPAVPHHLVLHPHVPQAGQHVGGHTGLEPGLNHLQGAGHHGPRHARHPPSHQVGPALLHTHHDGGTATSPHIGSENNNQVRITTL